MGFVSTALALASAVAPAWQDAGSEGASKYFVRLRAESPFQEYRIEGKFDGPVAAVIEIVTHPGRHAGVNPTLKEERFLGEQGGRKVFYNRYDPPLGDDRDSCLAMSEERGPGGVVTLRWDSRVGCIPPVEGVVRMPANEGFFVLTPADDGRATQFVYQTFQDIGGWGGWAFIVNPTTFSIVKESVRAIGRAAMSGSAGGR
jgi:hypothetical protein